MNVFFRPNVEPLSLNNLKNISYTIHVICSSNTGDSVFDHKTEYDLFFSFSYFQVSTGKLCPGDEIVKIGDKVLSSSSYQEIWELMLNLPVTLSLDIKKPVSGI